MRINKLFLAFNATYGDSKALIMLRESRSGAAWEE